MRFVQAKDRQVEAAAGNVKSASPGLRCRNYENQQKTSCTDHGCVRPDISQKQEATKQLDPRQNNRYSPEELSG
jgi:hypothetical protein